MCDATPEISIVDTHFRALAWVANGRTLHIRYTAQIGEKTCCKRIAIDLFMLSQVRGTKEDRAKVIEREFFRHKLSEVCDPIAKWQHDEFLEKYGQKICDHLGVNLSANTQEGE